MSMLEAVLGWIFLAGTALSLSLSVKKNQDDAGLMRAIGRLQQERELMNQFVETGFALSLDEAIGVLEGLKGGLRRVIQVLREARGT